MALQLLVSLPLYGGFIDNLDRVINRRVEGCNTGQQQWGHYSCLENPIVGAHLSTVEKFQGDVQQVINRMEEWTYIRQKVTQKRELMIAARSEYGQLAQELSSAGIPQEESALGQLKKTFLVLAEVKRSINELKKLIDRCDDSVAKQSIECRGKHQEFAIKLSALQAMELTLVSSSPLLSHSAFQGQRRWMGLSDSDGGLLLASSAMDDRQLDQKFRRQLRVALRETRKKLDKRIGRYGRLLATTHQRKDGSFICRQCTSGIEDYLEDSDLLFELNPQLDSGNHRHPLSLAICRLSQKYYLARARGVLSGFLLDSALVITPMGIAGALKGAVSVLKVAPKGAKILTPTLQVAGEGAVIGAEINRLSGELEQCEVLELDLAVTGGRPAHKKLLGKLKSCRQRVKERAIDTSLALVGGIGLAGAHMIRVARPMIDTIQPKVASKVKGELLDILRRGGLNATDQKMTGSQFNQMYDDLINFAKRHNITVIESTPGRMGATGVFPRGVDRLELVGFKRATELAGEVGATSRHELAHMFHTLQMRATLLESNGIKGAKKLVDGKVKDGMNNYLKLFESSSSRNYREFEKAVTSIANPTLDGKWMKSLVNTSAADYSRRLTSLLDGTEQATVVGKGRFPSGRSLQDVYGKVMSSATVATGGSFTELGATRLTPAIFAIYYSNNTFGLRDKVDAMLEREPENSF